MKIIGIIPAGGKGTRLGLPFPKELMSIRFDSYYPISLHTLRGMMMAGVDEVHWVISEEKKQIRNFYESKDFGIKMFWHYQNEGSGKTRIPPYNLSSDADIILFGLPDTIYEDLYAFKKLVLYLQQNESDIILGLFRGTQNDMRVDRFYNRKLFIKSTYHESPSFWFWGILGWTNQYWQRIVEKFKNDSTILYEGQMLNILSSEFPLATIKLGQYLDLGTWQNISRFASINVDYIEQVTQLPDSEKFEENDVV